MGDLFLLLLQYGPLIIALALVLFCLFLVWRIIKARHSRKSAQGDALAMQLEGRWLGVQIFRLLGIAVWPMALFLAVTQEEVNLVAALLVALIVSFICFMVARLKRFTYNKMFKQHVVSAELGRVFDNLVYLPNQRFSDSELAGLDFFTCLDRVSGNDYIEADYRGVRFCQCDLLIEEKHTETVKGSDGRTKTVIRYQEVFSGRAMRFDLANNFISEIRVIGKRFPGEITPRSWQKLEAELVEFNDMFKTYATDAGAAFTLLTPQMIESVFYLNKSLNAPLALYFKQQTLYAFVALNREAFDISGTKTVLEEKTLLQKDIEFVTTFLDTMYFKQRAGSAALAAG